MRGSVSENGINIQAAYYTQEKETMLNARALQILSDEETWLRASIWRVRAKQETRYAASKWGTVNFMKGTGIYAPLPQMSHAGNFAYPGC